MSAIKEHEFNLKESSTFQCITETKATTRDIQKFDSIKSSIYIRATTSKTFPHYWEKGEMIGCGSFGKVFKVKDKSNSSEEQFVVKELPLDPARKNENWNTFQLETDILFLLQDHERIVPFYGYSIEADFAYIFMEYMSEGSLANFYQDNLVQEEKCFFFVKQILEGLAYLHDQGIIHRDIKGANILLERGLNIRLTDFGISKIVTKTTVNFTEQKGSFRWMAPEICNPQNNYCFKSDIWSVGCTVVEVLTRDLPYRDIENTIAVIFKVGFAEPPEFPGDVSERMRCFLQETFKVRSERKSAKILMEQFFQNDLQEPDEENSPVRPIITETKVTLSEQECTKNKGHDSFIAIDRLTKAHLPLQHQDDTTLELIKTVCGLTVKLEVNETSQQRPDTWPDSSVPYPKYDQDNIPKTRSGTGMVYNVTIYKDDARCPCQKCLPSSEPTKTWGVIEVMTAAHVVFDNSEAMSLKCILFYDNNESEEFILERFQLVSVDVGKNWCIVQCSTCDLHLLNKVTILLDEFEKLCKQHNLSEDGEKRGFIVSHPHGGPKQISLGKLIDIKVINKTWNQYLYDIPTCPGSSGAYVHIFGKSGSFWHYPHLHSGITANGLNCSSTGYYASNQLVCLKTHKFQNVQNTKVNRNSLKTLTTDQYHSASAKLIKEKILLKYKKVSQKDELTILNKFKNIKEIVEYFGSRIEDDKIIASFSYMPMGSLETYYQKNGPLSEGKCCLYVKQILKGFQFLHDEHVIHFNIRGKNVLLESESHIRISGLENSKHEPQLTKSAHDLDIRWTAPETINEKFDSGKFGVKADIWSLGCTIVELITGDFPYSEIETMEVIFVIGHGKPPKIKNEIKMELTRFIEKCFLVRPTDRFSATMLLDEPWLSSSTAINENDEPTLNTEKLVNNLGQEYYSGESANETEIKEDGWAALMIASENGQTETVKTLVSSGENVNDVDKDGWSALMYASQNGHTKTVQALIDSGANVNNVEKDSRSEIMMASLHGHTETLKILIDSGANVNDVKKKGWTALMLASQRGHKETVKTLTGSGANVNDVDKDGWSALMFASKNGHTETVKALIKTGANVNDVDKNGRSALMIAAGNGHIEIITTLINSGGNANDVEKNGWSALMFASHSGHTKTVKTLIKLGVNVNDVNGNGRPALMIAAGNGHLEIVKTLIDSGANVDDVEKKGWSALMFASLMGHTEIVKILIDSGANVNNINKEGWSSLMMASQNGHTKTVRALCESGANINLFQKDGWTALMIASQNGHTETVKTLIDSGANVNNLNKNGCSALMSASLNGNTETVKALIYSGANVNVVEVNGWSALMFASNNGHTETVKTLTNSGAKINLFQKDGWSALMFASQKGHIETVKALIDSGANVNAVEVESWPSIIFASPNQHIEKVKTLIDLNAKYTNPEEIGLSALHDLMASPVVWGNASPTVWNV